MKIPLAGKTMDATISIFKCGTVTIRLPRDAHSWCPDNHTPRFVKSVEGIAFIFDAPNSEATEWISTVSSPKQEERQELSQRLQ
jgi:hypothetical protein